MNILSNDQLIIAKDVLFLQGLTDSKTQRPHLEFIKQTMQSCPTFNIKRYRVNKNNSSQPMMG